MFSCTEILTVYSSSNVSSLLVFRPVLILNSHYDVVPAALEDWTVDPFEAIRKDGKVYGRGAQDMKCVCVQYIEAIRKLHSIHPEFRPQRTIHLTFGKFIEFEKSITIKLWRVFDASAL